MKIKYFLTCFSIVSIILFSFLTSKIFPNYEKTALGHKNSPPSKTHWFGTDSLGRDLFTRVLWGIKISFLIALVASFINLIIGFLWSSSCFFDKPSLDLIMISIIDIVYSIPQLLLAIIISMILKNSFFSLILSITITGWVTTARLLKIKFLEIKKSHYVLSSQIMGASFKHIFFKHLLPNSLSTVFSSLLISIPTAIYTEAFLSFLGLGVLPPKPSLGNLLKEGLSSFHYYPWQFFFPVIFIVLILSLFNLTEKSERGNL